MAFDAVAEVYSAFPWLASLGDEVYNTLVQGVLDNDPSAVVIQSVRDTQTYKTRFSGLAKRQAAGLPALSEAEYLQIETGYLNQLRNYNIQGTLGLTDPEALQQFAADMIGADVSVQEFNFRLDRGVALMRDSADFVQQAFTEFYGAPISDDALLVYFLDPQRGTDIIEDQIAAAQVGGEAFKHGLNVTRTRAEILRKEGVTADLARQGYADIAREQPVLDRLAKIHQLNPLSQVELEEFFFHENADIASRRNKTFTTALAAFQEGGARNVTREGGLGELVDRNRAV